MKTAKKIFSLAAASLIICGGVSIDRAACADELRLLTPGVAYAADVQPWVDDVNEATADDTMVYKVYIGKPVKDFIADFSKREAWRRIEDKDIVIFEKNQTGYREAIYVFPQKENPDLIGEYRINFFVTKEEMADEIYMQAEKNFRYNFGKPSIKKGMSNMTWFLSDIFCISVEYNEYDPRLPVAKGYPYAISIHRSVGDYSKYFQSRK